MARSTLVGPPPTAAFEGPAMPLDEMITRIVAAKREQWANAPAALTNPERTRPAPAGRFSAALRRADIAVIAEVKPRSPLKGELWPVEKAVDLAQIYTANGASGISVLANNPFFGGSPELVAEVTGVVPTPVLYKEFVVDAREIELAYAVGADGVLIVVRTVDDRELRELIAAAQSVGIDPLVETFDETEIKRAVDAGATVIGINNRDLNTFTVDTDRARRLRELIPATAVAVAESGMKERSDIERVAADGFDAALIGETLLRSEDPGAKLQTLIGVPSQRP
ncbi:indole-3-glycerol-phosphate synthase [Pseudonocardiaceae bacterium YIM PH 21723]|nr:indole-3-glycerol-phosphate synthase [Pseudonocardiaceae bacterium YIM PH 21723]